MIEAMAIITMLALLLMIALALLGNDQIAAPKPDEHDPEPDERQKYYRRWEDKL